MSTAGLRFAKTHEWVRLEGDVATIGISAFAVQLLTDLVFIELPEVGRTVAVGESFGEVESVKAVSDIYAPVAGEIVETNEGLPDDLAALSDDPYKSGWILKLKVSDVSQVEALMDADAYDKHCEAEAH